MPTLSPEQFFARLTRGKLGPALLLLGAERYLRDVCRERIVEAWVPEGAREWGVTPFSAEEDSIDAVLNQAQTLPMLAPRQVVFLRDFEALEALDEKARNAALERLGNYLDDPAPFTLLVLEAVALDRRMSLYKLASKKALVVSVEMSEKVEDRVEVGTQVALQISREREVELSRDAAAELADSLDGELTRIHTELLKLATYVGDRRRIDRADVEALVISAKKYSVWQLAEVLVGGRQAQALQFLGKLLSEGEQPAALVGAIAWTFRKLIEAQDLPAHLPSWQAARRLGMRPETAELALRQSRRIAQAQLLEGLKALYEADSRLKSAVAAPRAVLEFLVARLASATAEPA